MPLPDLQVHGFKFIQGNGAVQAICAQVENIGEAPAPPTLVAERDNGRILHEVTTGELAPGQRQDLCVPRSELPVHGSGLSFSIDEQYRLVEMDEFNNIHILSVPSIADSLPPTSATPSPTPSPQPTQNGEQADLTVKVIKIHDRAPDGKDDCAIGQNTVTVVVKNGGKGDAGSFNVRLTVDDDDDYDATVDSLDAGQERDVSVSNVQMKKGQHKLKAVADPDHAVTEGKDDNNGLKVTARCTEAAS
jgi:subtilase family serine protease